ncbi:MAG: tetratricopeptide repeat-containing sulfotransferase family protein [Acetobacteraceae bacterium]
MPDQAMLSAILATARSGRHAEAVAAARSALSAGFEHPLLLNLGALGLEQEGKPAEAESLLRRAVQLAPQDAGCRNALGLCLLKLGRPREALAEFDAVVQLDAALPYAHVNRGNALQASGDVDGAQACYERALALDPRQAMALAGLANINCGRGAYSEARLWADKALAVMPGLTDAVVILAAIEQGQGELRRAEARVRELLGNGDLTIPQRAHAQGLLGDILDSAGGYEEAFAAYSGCNEMLRRLHADRYESALEYARDLRGWLEKSPIEAGRASTAHAGGDHGPSAHIFIIGFPRSGTTLLDVVLAGNPAVVSLSERELLVDAVHAFMRRPEDFAGLARASPATLARLRQAYWARVAAEGVDTAGKSFVDACALNSLKLPIIARLFPRAKILYAVRDPRDVVLSCFTHRFGISAPTFELLTIGGAASYYDAVNRIVTEATSRLALEICLVRHEDLVTAFAREMVRICQFLALEWHPAMGDFALRSRQRGEALPSMDELLRGIGTEGLGRWRNYRPHLEPVRELLEPWARRFYYGD